MSESRREPDPGRAGRTLLVVLIPTAIGLATEAAGDHLPPIDSRILWTILTGLVLTGMALVVVPGRLRRNHRRGPGLPARTMTAARLEVHDAVEVPGAPPARQTAYVPRVHDERLTAAVRQATGGVSVMVTLVGDSSTGKTRACYEAVQDLSHRWRVWHPLDPSRPEALLESLGEVRPRTVVWINDAHHYLATADPAAGERVAAGLRTLLADDRRGPVLVLATLWPQFWAQLTAVPADGQPDPHAQARRLLVGSEVPVPAAFTGPDLDAVRAAAPSDPRIALAVAEAEDGRIAQYLAGVPELLRRYRTAPAGARAVLQAAIDLRRLGHPVHLPHTLLHQIALAHLPAPDRTELNRRHGDTWFEHVIDDLDRPQHGIPGPLTRVSTDTAGAFRLADAIEQDGRSERAELYPPAPFWDTIAAEVTDTTLLTAFGRQAYHRGRFTRAAQLFQLSADRGDVEALWELSGIRARTGDWEGADRLAHRAAERGSVKALLYSSRRHADGGDWAGAETFARRAADGGSTDALLLLAQKANWNGAPDLAERFYRFAVRHGDTAALTGLAELRAAGDHWDAAELFARRAADGGDTRGLRRLAAMRENQGDRAEAERWYEQAAEYGDVEALRDLGELVSLHDRDKAESLFRQALHRGHHMALQYLTFLWEQYGGPDRGSRLQVLREAADHGSPVALRELAWERHRSGDLEGTERLLLEAADHGYRKALDDLARLRESAGDRHGAEMFARQAADRGDTAALRELADIRERAGNPSAAERLIRQVADYGDTAVLREIAQRLADDGDRIGAENLYRKAINRGDTEALEELSHLWESAGDEDAGERLWRFGLADDGSTAQRPGGA